jgi:hypothetical protein
VVDHQIRHPLAYVCGIASPRAACLRHRIAPCRVSAASHRPLPRICGIASPLAAHLRHRIAVAAARHTS